MYPPSVRRKALALLAGGTSVNATSKALGVSRSAIGEWRVRGPISLTTADCPAPADSTQEYSALLGYYFGDGCISPLARTFSMRVACDATYPGSSPTSRIASERSIRHGPSFTCEHRA